MFKHILVPLDGSKLSEASLDPASVLAERLRSEVLLLHVIEVEAPSEVHQEPHLTNAEEAKAYLDGIAERAFPPGVKVTTHVHTAPVKDVASSIVDHATREFEPDLIVSCTHGTSGMRDVLFGSIAQKIVARGSTPVLFVRPGAPKFKLERILAPLDPDSVHDEGLPLAEALAKACDAELLLLSVVPTFSSLTGEQAAASSLMPATTQAMLDIHEETAAAHLQEHLKELAGKHIRASAEVARGDAAPTILKHSDQSQADIIVLSTHGKAGVKAFWARSVAPHVVQRARIPVLLIPLQGEK